ncbi:peroxidase-related enzyme [Rahnella sp. SAP-1]|uniref:Peroxidase-related enzyme n=1 Tax=Rouxiella aceris TaxID=2703884 RepID=A0A848MNZ2_9GAMM|nr:peroxidase-related enzyme [Rouxiella aceris]NMP28771.1 peroxidase-related enzyme [Rouxiella aceris]
MEQQRRAAHDGWYHETQSSQQRQTPAVPCQIITTDSFLLGLEQKLAPSFRILLTQRSGLLSAGQRCYNQLFPEEVPLSRTQTLSLYDRLSSALTVAQVTGIQPLCSHYAARLAPLNCPDASRESNIRQTHLAQYARLLATQPSLINRQMLSQLQDVGLSATDIIIFSQLIGFVTFQARLLAIINALAGRPATVLPGFQHVEESSAQGFSLQPRRWQAYLPTLDIAQASQQQLDILDDCAEDGRDSAFYRLLVLDASSLSALSAIAATIMQPADSEKSRLQQWSAVVTSRLNGCLFCAGVHGHHYLQAGGQSRHIERLFQGKAGSNGLTTDKDPLVKAVQILAQTPEKFDAAALQLLLDAGYDHQQAVSILLASALFCWVNRLVQTLGDTRLA